jgi:hypothetical protein
MMKWRGDGSVEQSPVEPGSNTDMAHKEASESDDESDNAKTSICCLPGCLAASVVGFSFFVALPSGIILIVLSTNSNDTTLLAVGCVLITLPVIVLITVIVLCLNQKRLCCLSTCTTIDEDQQTRREQVVRTTTASGESPV